MIPPMLIVMVVELQVREACVLLDDLEGCWVLGAGCCGGYVVPSQSPGKSPAGKRKKKNCMLV